MDRRPEEDLEMQENNRKVRFFNLFNQYILKKIKKEKLGPATYFKKGFRSTLKIGSKPIPKQNFGSSSLRFSYENEQLVEC